MISVVHLIQVLNVHIPKESQHKEIVFDDGLKELKIIEFTKPIEYKDKVVINIRNLANRSNNEN